MADYVGLIKRLRQGHYPHQPLMNEAADTLEYVVKDADYWKTAWQEHDAEIERLEEKVHQLMTRGIGND